MAVSGWREVGDMASRDRSLGGQVLGSHGSGCVHSEIKKLFKMENLESLGTVFRCIHKISTIVSEVIYFN